MKILSHSLEETAKAANTFLKKISERQTERATIVGLFGDLGSGKTTFTQAVGKILNIQEVMTSPTFVIEKRYNVPNSTSYIPYSTIIHIDAYRLESGKEILNLNFAEDRANPKNLILIEWPERVAEALPEDLIKINFRFISETEREIDMV